VLTDIRELEALVIRIRVQDGLQVVVGTADGGFVVRLHAADAATLLAEAAGPTILRALETAWSRLKSPRRSFPAMLCDREDWLTIPERLRRHAGTGERVPK
jgi:hypothetical protein